MAAHPLDFDASVLPCSLVLPHAKRLDEAVMGAFCKILDLRPDECTAAVRTQVFLPRRFGGLQVSSAETMCTCARVATLVTHGHALRETVEAWQELEKCEPPLRPNALDGVAAEEHDLLDGLCQLGIRGLTGTGQPLAEVSGSSDPLRVHRPDTHLLSSYLGAAASAIFEKLRQVSDRESRARLYSAGGPSAGSCFTAPLSMDGVHLADWQITEAMRFRLGIPQPGPRILCKNQKQNGDPCGAHVDAWGTHPIDCPVGPLRTRRHDDLADDYASILEECGAISRREAFVLEFSSAEEAWLDVWSYGIPELTDLLLDISVRNPLADRYLAKATEVPGAAAAAGEAEKEQRYPQSGGRRVWPVIYEAFGRAGDAAEQLLQILAAAYRRRAHRRGRACGMEIQRWRARLDATLQRGIAAQLVSARLGLPGRRTFRRRPLDMAAVEAGAVV